MKEEKNILDASRRKGKDNSKRNSCLFISALILAVFIPLAYVLSKEISNALNIVDKGLAASNQTYEQTNEDLKNILLRESKYGATVEKIERISLAYNALMDSTINVLISQSGGWKANSNEQELANPKNRVVPTKILAAGKLGDTIEERIRETSIEYNEIMKTVLNDQITELPLKLRMDQIKQANQTWAEYNFNQMPLMAVLPILRKLKNDENESKSIIYNIMADGK